MTSVMSLVLMVAISVVVAAVIATFALGMTEDVGEDAPSASFEVIREDVDFSGATYNIVFVSHKHGDKIDAENLHVTVNGKQAWDVAGIDDGTGRTVKPTERAGTLMAGKTLRVVYWPNDYTGFPLSNGELIKSHSGGCGDVLKPAGGSDCTLNNDIVGREEPATIRIIYEFPKTGETVVLDELHVSARKG